MSGIKLIPVEGGEAVEIPKGKTTIGRGSFLQVADKRVSRNHATVEVNEKGKLIVVPIHTNPCFCRPKGKTQNAVLPKDQPRVLEHGDVLSLLPDKLFFRVIYPGEKDDDDSEVEKKNVTDDEKRVKLAKAKQTNGETTSTAHKPKVVKASSNNADKALPPGKARVLPGWMVGAAGRAGIVENESKGSGKKTGNRGRPPVKQTSSVKDSPAKTPARQQKSVKAAYNDDDDDEDEWDEGDDDDDDDDYGAKKKKKSSKSKKPASVSKRPAPRRASARGKRRSYDEDDEDEDDEDYGTAKGPKRRPRAASLKKPRYTDDDFAMSDESLNLEEEGSGSEDAGPSRHGRKNEDSDFVLDEDDSGSDWGGGKGKSKQPPKTKKGRPPAPKANHGGRKGSRTPATPARGKRKHNSDDDDDGDNYVPRSSKRRAAVAAVSRMKAVSDDEDFSDDDSDGRKPALRKGRSQTKRAPTKRRTRIITADDDDEEEEEEAGQEDENEEDEEEGSGDKKKKKKRVPCKYGADCYRKNPQHFEEFSHPGDEDEGAESNEDEDEDEGEEKKKGTEGGSKRPAKQPAGDKKKADKADADVKDEEEDEAKESKDAVNHADTSADSKKEENQNDKKKQDNNVGVSKDEDDVKNDDENEDASSSKDGGASKSKALSSNAAELIDKASVDAAA